MSTATLFPVPDSSAPGPPASAPSAAAAFLTGFGATLLPLVAGVVALGPAWSSSAVQTWPVAGAVVAGWALAAAGWLHSRGWAPGAVLAVLGVPAAVLAGTAALGWLAPGGLVLWGPVGAVLTTALAMTVHPSTPTAHPEELR